MSDMDLLIPIGPVQHTLAVMMEDVFRRPLLT